jgi:hypothetical protein
MVPKTNPSLTRTALIQELRTLLNQAPMTERDAFRLIGSFIREAPDIAYALCAHIHDAIQETYTVAELAQQDQAAVEGRTQGEPLEYFVDVNYNQVITLAYERAFFNQETAGKYGTERYAQDLPALDALVGYLRAAVGVEQSGAGNVVPMRRHVQH